MGAFPNLRTLHFSLNLPAPAGFQLGLNVNTLEKLVETIFCNFFRDKTESRMEELKSTVRRIQPGQFGADGLETVQVKVKRVDGSVVPKLGQGGYESLAERSLVTA